MAPFYDRSVSEVLCLCHLCYRGSRMVHDLFLPPIHHIDSHMYGTEAGSERHGATSVEAPWLRLMCGGLLRLPNLNELCDEF